MHGLADASFSVLPPSQVRLRRDCLSGAGYEQERGTRTMGSFRGVIAASFIALVIVTVPAVGDDGRPAGFDQPYYPAIWQGLYGGVNVGWGWSGDASGGVGGGQIGYNWQASPIWVVGLEADIQGAFKKNMLPSMTTSAFSK